MSYGGKERYWPKGWAGRLDGITYLASFLL
jgi:hypothetical protein